MPGVPRSKRCQRCKRMKIKCDENWPCCSSCLRARVNCSGPPNLQTFVLSGSHTGARDSSESTNLEMSCSIVEQGLMTVDTKTAPGGASFARFRLCSSNPRPNPTTVADRVAARLVGYLDNEDAPRDMLVSFGYTRYLPSRLSQSAALRDCVALVCSGWINFKRGAPVEEVMDLKLYGKALRSLQRAIDGCEQMSCETLAAATLLERFEVIFDNGRPYHRALHASGLQSLMMKRGPPKVDDGLDLNLAIENHASLVALWAVEGGENFYFRPSWRDTIWEAINSSPNITPERRDCCSIGWYFGYWPELIHSFQRIHARHDSISREVQVDSLRSLTERLDKELRITSIPIIGRLYACDKITEQTDNESPFGLKFDFATLDAMQCLASYATMATILNRIQHHLNVLQDRPTKVLDLEHRDLCRQIWMCISSFRELGTVASMLSSASMYIAYEGATYEDEKEFLLDFVIEAAAYKGRFPKDREVVERFVVNTARAMTGQIPFDTEMSAANQR